MLLRRELIGEIIAKRFGSYEAFVAAWENRIGKKIQTSGRARNKSTIHRWINNGFPSNRDDIFGFAAALDVDPICLIHIDEEFIKKVVRKERVFFQFGRENLTPLFHFWSMYSPGELWPNMLLANTYYGRDWSISVFTHDGSTDVNKYAALLLSSTSDSPLPATAYHIAYRRVNAVDKLWRPYGSVLAYENEMLLISESGHFERRCFAQRPIAVCFETFFGIGAVEFRLSSIHGFKTTIQHPSQQTDLPKFPG